MKTKKRIAIIAMLDGYANSNMPLAIMNKFDELGSTVDLINTQNPLQTVKKAKFKNKIYKLYTLFFACFDKFINVLLTIQELFFNFLKPYTNYYLLLLLRDIRAVWLGFILRNNNYDLVLSETELDAWILTKQSECKTWLDSPTPWADELYFGNEITKEQYLKMLKDEKVLYSKVDFLSFHWGVYTDYTKKYIYQGDNHVRIDSGCNIKKDKVKFIEKPRIVYLGFLGGYWINLELLSKLSKIYTIDIYGSPAPDKKYGLNYKGYSKPDILSQYQFGLITLSKDRLRSEGFSAKHVEYLSYGLPVLVPEWRISVKNMGGTIFYNEDNFKQVIDQYTKKTNWESVHKSALEEAKNYEWVKVLKQVEKIYKSLD